MSGSSGRAEPRTRGEPTNRSFHVLYADATDDRERIEEAIGRSYTTTTVDSAAEIRDALDHEIDCVVIGDGFDAADVVSMLENVVDVRPTVPVVRFAPTVEPAVCRSMVSLEASAIETYGDRPLDEHAIGRLAARIDEFYHRSISDIREVVFEISRSLMSAAPDETDIEIEWGLQLVGRQLDADRCLVFELEGEALEPTHCWDRRAEHPTDVESIDIGSFPGFETMSKSFDPHAVPPAVDDELDIDVPEGFVGRLGAAERRSDRRVEAKPKEHPYLRERNLESLLAVPIVVDWELEGVLAIEQRIERPWPRSLRQQVRTLGELVGYTLDRERRRRELARQNEHLERFTSVVSHDLRNPLNVLQGYADLVEETEDPAYVEEIVVAAERMETMIDDLLALARQGEHLDERRLDLERTVRAAWNGVETANAVLETRELGTVEGDPGRLQQAFENLFRNAIEHAGPSVRVTVCGTDDGFAVEDDGPGIPAEERDRVVQKGYTGGNGTGLGLSIVTSVVDAHGWSVSVEAADSGGARFEFVTATESERRPERDAR
ncbi:GAF domain-containing protein [Natrarchaeobius oligotrophus]|uniref:histidine kinase n=2 Tax=Natrarchaeobius TaxID=2501796 RepID=A0A3N6PJS1_NATCH|nr:GAF domain-containing protein [Natrarchaeobius chitinivorans]